MTQKRQATRQDNISFEESDNRQGIIVSSAISSRCNHGDSSGIHMPQKAGNRSSPRTGPSFGCTPAIPSVMINIAPSTCHATGGADRLTHIHRSRRERRMYQLGGQQALLVKPTSRLTGPGTFASSGPSAVRVFTR